MLHSSITDAVRKGPCPSTAISLRSKHFTFPHQQHSRSLWFVTMCCISEGQQKQWSFGLGPSRFSHSSMSPPISISRRCARASSPAAQLRGHTSRLRDRVYGHRTQHMTAWEHGRKCIPSTPRSSSPAPSRRQARAVSLSFPWSIVLTSRVPRTFCQGA